MKTTTSDGGTDCNPKWLRKEEDALPLSYLCSVVQLSWKKFGGNLNLAICQNNTWTQQPNITDSEGCWSSFFTPLNNKNKSISYRLHWQHLLRLLEGQNHISQLREGMGASFSRRYSAWKSQFANVFHALPHLEKLQGEAEQTCLGTTKAVSDFFSVGHQELQGEKGRK